MDAPLGLGGLSLVEVLTLAEASLFVDDLPAEWQNLLVRDVTEEQWLTLLGALPQQRSKLIVFLDQYQSGLGQQIATSLVPYTTGTSALPPDLQAHILSHLTPEEFRKLQHLPGFTLSDDPVAMDNLVNAMAQHDWPSAQIDAKGVLSVYGHAELGQAVELVLAGTAEFRALAVHFVLTDEGQELLHQVLQKRVVVHLHDGAILTTADHGEVHIHEGGTITTANGAHLYLYGGTVADVQSGSINIHSGGTVINVTGGSIQVREGGTITTIQGGYAEAHEQGVVTTLAGGFVKVFGGTVTAVTGGNVHVHKGSRVTGVTGGTISAVGPCTISLGVDADVDPFGMVMTDAVSVSGFGYAPLPPEVTVIANGRHIHGPPPR